MDGMQVDTSRVRDTVTNLSELLVATMRVVEQLRQTTVASSAFGAIGSDVHRISGQVQSQAATNISELSAVFQLLNRRSASFSQDVDRTARCGQDGLNALRPMS
jgi:methyl-accepting chemotaxis protein